RLLTFLLQIESHGLFPLSIREILPAASFVFQNHALQHRAHDLLFLWIKAADGFKLQAQVVIGAALVFAKQEQIRTYLRSGGEFADDVERGLRSARFVKA